MACCAILTFDYVLDNRKLVSDKLIKAVSTFRQTLVLQCNQWKYNRAIESRNSTVLKNKTCKSTSFQAVHQPTLFTPRNQTVISSSADIILQPWLIWKNAQLSGRYLQCSSQYFGCKIKYLRILLYISAQQNFNKDQTNQFVILKSAVLILFCNCIGKLNLVLLKGRGQSYQVFGNIFILKNFPVKH